MRLFEAIIEANRRRVAGEVGASVPLVELGDALPVAALTCIDARLNRLLPEMLGLPEEKFIWLRNAGNIITGPVSSTMRSLAMSCAIKGAKEIAIIGHSDCQVCKTTALTLLERFGALGVERSRLPENLVEYFGLFASERQNVMRGVDIVRSSPLIGAKVPVHGLLIDVKTGQLEWAVNGYEAHRAVAGRHTEAFQKADDALETMSQIGSLTMGEMKFPDSKIGEVLKLTQDWVHKAEKVAHVIEDKLGPKPPAPKPPSLPPPLTQPRKPRFNPPRNK